MSRNEDTESFPEGLMAAEIKGTFMPLVSSEEGNRYWIVKEWTS